jgi:hypothetical protein
VNFKIKSAANIALPKLGQDIETSTAVMWQLQLWAGLFLISLRFISASNFQFIISTGLDNH